MSPAQAALSTPAAARTLDSVFDLVVNGGPLMIPIGLCSIVAFAYFVERTIHLREGELGGRRTGERLVRAVQEGPDRALVACDEEGNSMGRVIAAGLRRLGSPVVEVEKAVEDAGRREVKRLSAGLKPLVVVAMIAPLLGLLGTVWGMIEAFSNIALKEGLGKPELLASGISQALVTTAAGLTIAIPTQAAYYWFKSRIDRFVRRTEEVYERIEGELLLASRPAPLEIGVEA